MSSPPYKVVQQYNVVCAAPMCQTEMVAGILDFARQGQIITNSRSGYQVRKETGDRRYMYIITGILA